MPNLKRSLITLAAAASLAIAGLAPAALARNGADDPAGHNAGDDHGGRVTLQARHHHRHHHAKHLRAHRARHGADDPAGDDRGGRGGDDGANHR